MMGEVFCTLVYPKKQLLAADKSRRYRAANVGGSYSFSKFITPDTGRSFF